MVRPTDGVSIPTLTRTQRPDRVGAKAQPAASRAKSGSASKLAAHLFLTAPDLCPLMVLFVALTGRNIETIKELPTEHRILEGRAVELRVIKRRRGPRWWHTTVSWEIGEPHRELHTPGGLYLLIHQLTAPGRARRPNGFGRSGATPPATPSAMPPSATSASTPILSPRGSTAFLFTANAGSPNTA
jgi:hypothetical protein